MLASAVVLRLSTLFALADIKAYLMLGVFKWTVTRLLEGFSTNVRGFKVFVTVGPLYCHTFWWLLVLKLVSDLKFFIWSSSSFPYGQSGSCPRISASST